MNLPIGEIIEENLVLSQIEVKGLLEALIEKEFTGYIANTIDGFAGIEEGILLFKKGNLIGSYYEYTNYDIVVYGSPAVNHTLNSLTAEKGIMDIISLSNQQADLVTAFNDRLKITIKFKKGELLGLVRRRYTTEHAEKTLSKVIEKHESRKSVLKRLGLSEIG